MASFIDDLRDALTMVPRETTVGELLDSLPKAESATCRHCRQPIERYLSGMWRHCDQDHKRLCRAASFREDTGWDERLHASWRAEPGFAVSKRSIPATNSDRVSRLDTL